MLQFSQSSSLPLCTATSSMLQACMQQLQQSCNSHPLCHCVGPPQACYKHATAATELQQSSSLPLCPATSSMLTLYHQKSISPKILLVSAHIYGGRERERGREGEREGNRPRYSERWCSGGDTCYGAHQLPAPVLTACVNQSSV
jgi:hypothetical protein